MTMAMTVTQTKGTVTTQHVIDFSGLSGLIIWVLLGSLFLFVIAYSTTGWQVISTFGNTVSVKLGIWESCNCQSFVGSSVPATQTPIASQALLTIGLMCLISAVAVGMVYMFLHKINKDMTLILLIISSASAAFFIMSGFIAFGVQAKQYLNYSFALAVISCMMTIGATVVACLHMKNTRKPSIGNEEN